jgi:rhodanese-related sulfurtransferase
MATNVRQLAEAAKMSCRESPAAQAQELIATGDALVVDVREASEVQQSGKVVGSVHVPRGLVDR